MLQISRQSCGKLHRLKPLARNYVGWYSSSNVKPQLISAFCSQEHKFASRSFDDLRRRNFSSHGIRNNDIKTSSILQNTSALNEQSTITEPKPAAPTIASLFEEISSNIRQDTAIASIPSSASFLSTLELIYSVLEQQQPDTDSDFEKNWVPLFHQIKEETLDSSNLISLLLKSPNSKNHFDAAWLICALVLRSKQDYAFTLLFDFCAQSLVDNQIDLSKQVFGFWNEKYLGDNQLRLEMEETAFDKQRLVERLIGQACNSAQTLTAATFAIRLYRADKTLLSSRLLSRVIHGLLYYRPSVTPIGLRALQQMHAEIPSLFRLSAVEKRKVIRLGFKVQKKGVLPSFVNDVYDFMVKVSGDSVPPDTVQALIRSNLRYNNVSRAASLFKYLQRNRVAVADMDIDVLALLIRHLSQNKKYLHLASKIVELVPPYMQMTEGLIETLLSYCARTRNEELSMKLYKSLETPVARSVLTALLHLHISFDDNSGAESVLAEISRRGDYLKPVEFSMVTGAALKLGNLTKAMELIRKNPPHVAHMGYGLVMNAAIDRGDLPLVNEVMSLVEENLEVGSPELNTISHLIIKKLCRFEGCESARLQYLKWKIMKREVVAKIQMPNPKTQLIVLRTIVDQALKEKNERVFNWGLHELRHLGVHTNDLIKELMRRTGVSRKNFQGFLKPGQ